MRWSKSFIPTLKENPQEAEAISHKLMVRAGLIRRLTAGAYTYLPMGYKSLRKAERIIREEMNSAGAVELLMPVLQPPELWRKTGRYELIGDVMIKYEDRHGKEIALGPTHEEVITDLVSRDVRSYRELPLILYQIQTKFRDEIRPRFGVIRSCEFIMKDAYSFDVDEGGMERSYDLMYKAYCRIFDRCGLPYLAVEADSGFMGGAISHEFMVPSEIGEDRIVLCAGCGYAASTEVAAVKGGVKPAGEAGKLEKMAEVSTPSKSSVEDVSAFLKVDPKEIIKTLIYLADEKPVAVLVRGDHEANGTKIKNKLKAATLELADEAKVLETTGGAMGFSGPAGLNMPVLADHAVRGMVNAVAGSNVKDKHLINVNQGRDFKVDEWLDARMVTFGDPCPKCGGNIEIKNAIELGHTFKLGTKYSESLNAKFLDEKGKERFTVMGCYGIGVNRILAALIERSSDEEGIIWPVNLAPCEVVIIPVNKDDESVVGEAERLYKELVSAGIDVILDDRDDKSPGVKFKDASLVGFPLQVVVGKRSLDKGKVEIKERKTGKSTLVNKDDVTREAKEILEAART